MDVFEFDKSPYMRLEECSEVLKYSTNKVGASDVKREWSYFIEIQLEPTGYSTK